MYVFLTLSSFLSNPDVPTHKSKVILVCNKDSRADPEFHLVNENAMVRIC